MEHKVPKHFIDFLLSRGMSPEQIMRTSSEMSRKGMVNWQDLVWSLLQGVNLECALNATSEEQFFKDQHEIYSEMCNLRRRYENKKANDIWTVLNINKARMASCSHLVMKVGVAGGDKRCKYSFSFKEKRFKMEEALEGSIVDLEKCSNPVGCTCAYIFQPLRDNEGRLVRKK